MIDIWFHRYENGRDIEGKFDYNSWIESERGLKLAASLDKDTIIAEGYKELKTGRKYLAKMGDWRFNKDEEVELDGIGGVNILVKAEVHRSGRPYQGRKTEGCFANYSIQVSISLVTRSRTKRKRKALRRWPKELDIRSTGYRTMSYGILTQRKSLETHDRRIPASFGGTRRQMLPGLRTLCVGSDRQA